MSDLGKLLDPNSDLYHPACSIDEWRDLESRYGYDLVHEIADVVRKKAENKISESAAVLGSKGGSAGTDLQNKARAANSKNAGRPKGSKNKPKDAR